MNNQQIIEKAFKCNNISNLRKFKNDKSIDFSFSNNIVIKYINDNNLHFNFVKIIINRPEVDLSHDNYIVIKQAIKRNDHKALSLLYSKITFDQFIEKNEGYQILPTLLESFYEHKTTKDTLSWILKSEKNSFSKNKETISYIIHDISNLDIKIYLIKLFIKYIKEDDFFILKETIKIKNKKNKLIILKNLFKNFIEIDKEFVLNNSSFEYEYNFFRNQISYNLRIKQNNNYKKINIKMIENYYLYTQDKFYNYSFQDFILFYSENVFCNNNDYKNLELENKIFSLIIKNKDYINDKLLKDLILISLYSKNNSLFYFLYNNFNIKENIKNNSYYNLYISNLYNNLKDTEFKEKLIIFFEYLEDDIVKNKEIIELLYNDNLEDFKILFENNIIKDNIFYLTHACYFNAINIFKYIIKKNIFFNKINEKFIYKNIYNLNKDTLYNYKKYINKETLNYIYNTDDFINNKTYFNFRDTLLLSFKIYSF